MTEMHSMDRRTALKLTAMTLAASSVGSSKRALAEIPRVLPAGTLPGDARLGRLKDLDGYFPFTPSSNPEEWSKR